jgi:2-keto-3-deoxy-L-rhamnonate aldolase RhmA
MPSRSSLRSALAQGPPLLATFNLLPSAGMVELIAIAGFDAVIVDTEHGPHTLAEVQAAVLAGQACDLPVIVRVPDASAAGIGAVLDVGAGGVLVPQVHSAGAVARAVRAARYAPEGERGANPYVRAAGYAGDPRSFARANEEVAVLVMMESAAALAAAPDILAVPGLDGIFVGPVDLSHSLGVPGQPEHPRVLSALREVAGLAAERNVAVGAFAATPERALDWYSRGARLVACGVDSALVLDGMRRCAELAQAGARSPQESSSQDSPSPLG